MNAPNETAARADLAAAIQQWNETSAVERPVQLTNDTASADYRVLFRPTIAECNGDEAVTSYYWCFDSEEDTVEVASRYIARQQEEFTERGVGFALVGEEHERFWFYDEFEEARLKSPFLSNTVTVAPTADEDGVSATEYQALERAVSYWNNNSAAYGEWNATFVVTNESSTADIEVRFVSDIQRCDESSDALGCAPVLSGDGVVVEQQLVRIERGYAQESLEVIIRHEFGHVLGLSHGQEPMPLMSATYDAQLAGDVPDLDTREYGFKDSVLTVYVDYESFDADRQQVRTEIVAAMEWYEAGNVDATPEDLQFTFTDDQEAADFVVAYNETIEDEGLAYEIAPYSTSVDTDDAAEYYARNEIEYGSEPDRLAYYFAEAAGYTIANAPSLDEAPPQGVRNSEYDDWPDT